MPVLVLVFSTRLNGFLLGLGGGEGGVAWPEGFPGTSFDGDLDVPGLDAAFFPVDGVAAL